MAAYAHIVCAVIGSGVLSLAWSMSWLGELCPCPTLLPECDHKEGLAARKWAGVKLQHVVSDVWDALQAGLPESLSSSFSPGLHSKPCTSLTRLVALSTHLRCWGRVQGLWARRDFQSALLPKQSWHWVSSQVLAGCQRSHDEGLMWPAGFAASSSSMLTGTQTLMPMIGTTPT